MSRYTRLDEAHIVHTIEDLRGRIASRFPQANLLGVCETFLEVSKRVIVTEHYLRRPIWPVRVIGGIAVLALIGLLIAVASFTLLQDRAQMTMGELIQTIEAGVNDVVFFGIAIFFLIRIESRIKRRKALEMLHELRSLTHIVDMHQLTKDPALLTSDGELSPAELGRYLDFCSDMLSLISKVAALMVQQFNDDVVLAAVNEIETLTTGLSRKVWQKITLLERPSLQP